MKITKISTLLTLVVLILMAVIVCGACQLQHGDEAQNTPLEAIHAVRYRILGTSPMVQVTFMNDQGGVQQFDVGYPESKNKSWSFNMGSGSSVSVSVQDLIGFGQTVTCQIYVDGTLWKTSTSKGDFVIATCSGIIGSR
jgi:hypothetical protein